MYEPGWDSDVMHTTPTSSKCTQSWTLTPALGHCNREFSFPLHWRLSNMIGPLPAPNLPTTAAINSTKILASIILVIPCFNTCDWESNLPTSYDCIHLVPVIVTYSSPPSINTNLHPSLHWVSPSYQSSIIVVAFYTNIIMQSRNLNVPYHEQLLCVFSIQIYISYSWQDL